MAWNGIKLKNWPPVTLHPPKKIELLPYIFFIKKYFAFQIILSNFLKTAKVAFFGKFWQFDKRNKEILYLSFMDFFRIFSKIYLIRGCWGGGPKIP